jgi:hypothetical protein
MIKPFQAELLDAVQRAIDAQQVDFKFDYYWLTFYTFIFSLYVALM